MPFTPFHLGPVLGLGVPLRKYIHLPTLLVASVVNDVEPFLVLLLGLNSPLHGLLHTFLLAVPAGFVLGVIMLALEPALAPLLKALLLEPREGVGLRGFLLAGAIGAALHVLLDAPLYGDIRPFYPLIVNPLYNPSLTRGVYALCIGLGLLGLIEYVALAKAPSSTR
ncbi:MAG: hydrolase [Thermofilaceae archaeon]